MPGLQTIEYYKNTEGLNRRSGDIDRNPKQADDILNMHPNRLGAWTVRPGYDAIDDVAITGTPRLVGGADFRRTVDAVTTRQKIVAADDGTIRDGDTPSTILKSGLPTGNLYDFTTFLNTLIIAQPGIKPLGYDGTVFNTLDQLTRAQIIVTHKNRLFWVDPDEPTRVRYTRIGTINDAPVLNFFDVNTDDGQKITGLETLYNQLIIFKDDSIFSMTGSDLDFDSDTTDFVVEPVNSDIGCISFRSIQKIRNRLYFLDEEGPYVFDGNDVSYIADAIEAIFDANSGDEIQLDQRLMNEAISTDDKELKMYMLGLVGANSVNVDTWLCYNYDINAWTVYEFADDISIVFKAENADNNKVLVFGDYAGKLHIFGDSKSDDEADIDWLYESTWLDVGNNTMIKRFRRALTTCFGTGADGMRIQAFLDFNETSAVMDVTKNIIENNSAWDVALWDVGVWDGLRRLIRNLKFGQGVSNGTTRGRHVKMRFSGSTNAESPILEGWSISFIMQGIVGTTQQNSVN